MTLHVFADVEQGSDEWRDQRRGIVTASVVGQLVSVAGLEAVDVSCPECGVSATAPCESMASGSKFGTPLKKSHPARYERARESNERRVAPVETDYSKALTLTLAAERITGYTDPTYMSMDMIRGVEDEPVARDLYSEHHAPAEVCGFMVRDDWGYQIGYSPDGTVGDDGAIEIKSRRQKKHMLTILADAVPPENMAQLQAGLLVSGRKWIDYVSYCAGMPLWVKRVTPDPKWQAAIVEAVAQFELNVAVITEKYTAAVQGLPMTTRRDELEIVL